MENTGSENNTVSDQEVSQDQPIAAEAAANGAATTPDPLEVAQATAKDWENKFLYLSADFENFRKRMQKERSDFLKFGHEDFIRDQLQILDNLERAVQHAKSFSPEKQSPFGQVLLGVEMTMTQFQDSLRRQGVSELKAEGLKFDPLFHEAVAQEAAEGKEPDTILREFQKGYLLHGRLLRPARVVTVKAAE